MSPKPPTSEPPVTLREAFEHFLLSAYEDPPTPIDPDEDIRTLYWHLRDAFNVGCLAGQSYPHAFRRELRLYTADGATR